MSKKLVSICLAMAFSLSIAGVSMAAKKATCEVKAVEGTTVTLDCGKKADKFKAGMKVKIKSAKKKVEGC